MSGKDKSVPVSDHAVLRYLEHIAGVDVEAIRRRMWQQARSAATTGASTTTVGGIKYRITKGHIVTVTAASFPEPRPLRFGKDET